MKRGHARLFKLYSLYGGWIDQELAEWNRQMNPVVIDAIARRADQYIRRYMQLEELLNQYYELDRT